MYRQANGVKNRMELRKLIDADTNPYEGNDLVCKETLLQTIFLSLYLIARKSEGRLTRDCVIAHLT